MATYFKKSLRQTFLFGVSFAATFMRNVLVLYWRRQGVFLWQQLTRSPGDAFLHLCTSLPGMAGCEESKELTPSNKIQILRGFDQIQLWSNQPLEYLLLSLFAFPAQVLPKVWKTWISYSHISAIWPKYSYGWEETLWESNSELGRHWGAGRAVGKLTDLGCPYISWAPL